MNTNKLASEFTILFGDILKLRMKIKEAEGFIINREMVEEIISEIVKSYEE